MQTPEKFGLVKGTNGLASLKKVYFGLNVAVASDVQKVENSSNEPVKSSAMMMVTLVIIVMMTIMKIWIISGL